MVFGEIWLGGEYCLALLCRAFAVLCFLAGGYACDCVSPTFAFLIEDMLTFNTALDSTGRP
jgi:hypothetical protein